MTNIQREKTFVRMIEDIKRRLAVLEKHGSGSSARTRDLVLAPGSSLVLDDADFRALTDDGHIVVQIDENFYGDRAIAIMRDDKNHNHVFSLGKPFDPDNDQKWRMYDYLRHPIVSEALFGDGLSRPFLSMPMQPMGAVGTAVTCGPWGLERTTVSGTFEDLFFWKGQRQNAYMMPVLNVRTSNLTTSAEVQLVDDAGSILVGFFQPAWTGVIATGSTADQEVRPPYILSIPGLYGSETRIRVQARRTAGAGTVTVAIRSCMGDGHE